MNTRRAADRLSRRFAHVCVIAVVLSACPPSALPGDGLKIVIVSDLPERTSILVDQGLRRSLPQAATLRQVTFDAAKAANPVTFLASLFEPSSQPSVVVALGTRPSLVLLGEVLPFPVVCLAVESQLTPALSDDARSRLHGVGLEFADDEILRRVSPLLPLSRVLGVLRSDADGGSQPSVVKSAGLEVHTYRVCHRRDVARAALRILADTDVLWLRADPLLQDPSIVRYLLGKALEQGRPVIGLSESYVRAGALLCLQPDFVAVGEQLARAVLAVSRTPSIGPDTDGPFPAGLDPPRKGTLYFNGRVARLLGIRLIRDPTDDRDEVVVIER